MNHPAIVFARHGETGPNRDGLVLGRSDPELTGEGHRQAACLAGALAGVAPTALYTSPLLRARQTAAAIGAACGLEPVVDDRLVEIDWGAWEGRAVQTIRSADIDRWRTDGAAPEGETLDVLAARVAAFCAERLGGDGTVGDPAVGDPAVGDRTVIAVSHVSPIKAAAAWALGVHDEVGLRMFLGLASLTRVEQRSRGPILVTFNETGHLAYTPAEGP